MAFTPQDDPKPKSPFKGFLPFFWLSIAYLGGVLLADAFMLSPWAWILGIFLALLLFVLTLTLPKALALTHYLRHWTKADQRLPGLILAIFFFLGGWRYADAQIEINHNHVAYYNEREFVELVGVLIEPPDIRDSHTNLIIRTDSMRVPGNETSQGLSQDVSGLVLVQVQSREDWAYGDRVWVAGQLQTPFEGMDFSYREYLSRKGILSTLPYAQVKKLSTGEGNALRAWLLQLRERGFATLHLLFPSPESDLLAGILLGRDQGLSEYLQDAFRKTGTSHIIAISGFNIAILAGLFSSIFTRLLGRKWGAITAILGITGFTVLVGGDAAVVRSAIMGSLGVLGGMFGRRQNGLNSLGLAVLLMCLLNPNVPWDIGFQLSAMATLGLVLYAQPLEEGFIKLASRKMPEDQAARLVGPVSEFFLFTLAAQVMTFPIIAYHFSGLSWIALIANPLILPAQSLVLILGGLAMLVGMLLPGLGIVLAVVALPFVRYTLRLVTWLARLPGGNLILPSFHPLWLILFYFLLFLLTLFPKDQRRSISQRIFTPESALLILSGIVIFVWNRVLTLPDNRLHLTLLDDQGTLLVQSPGEHAILIGGGESPSHLNAILGQILPAGRQSIDVLIVGSAAREDLNGIFAVIENMEVKMALWGINPEVNQTSRNTYTGLYENETPIHLLETGQSLDLGDDIHITVLSVEERNAILWLDWKNFSALIPTGKATSDWLTVPNSPDVIILPNAINIDDLPLWKINAWEPIVLLLPMVDSDLPLQGEHPLLEALECYPLITTLEYQWVGVSTDGEDVWIRGARD